MREITSLLNHLRGILQDQTARQIRISFAEECDVLALSTSDVNHEDIFVVLDVRFRSQELLDGKMIGVEPLRATLVDHDHEIAELAANLGMGNEVFVQALLGPVSHLKWCVPEDRRVGVFGLSQVLGSHSEHRNCDFVRVLERVLVYLISQAFRHVGQLVAVGSDFSEKIHCGHLTHNPAQQDRICSCMGGKLFDCVTWLPFSLHGGEEVQLDCSPNGHRENRLNYDNPEDSLARRFKLATKPSRRLNQLSAGFHIVQRHVFALASNLLNERLDSAQAVRL